MKKIFKNKMIASILIIVLTLSLLAGCTGANDGNKEPTQEKDIKKSEESKYPMEVVDGFGNKVTIENKPSEIVSAAPSHTEILYKLGLGDKIVGVTSYCDFPKEAKNKEQIGDAQNINIEKVIELNPDLVIQYGKGKEETNKKLKEAGITVLNYMPESIDSVIEVINELGKVTGTTEKAKQVTTSMERKKKNIVEKVKNKEKVKTFYEVWDEPLMTAGKNTFISELITLAGGENIGKDVNGYANYDVEQLLEKNPDVYLAANDNKKKSVESITSRPGYKSMEAVKNNKVYLLNPNVISRPGPRIVDALEMVAKKLHPDLFK